MIDIISSSIVPAIVCIAGIIMLAGRKNYFDSFLKGAKQGLECAFGLLPTLVALVVAVGMLNASGAVGFICEKIAPLTDKIGLPSGILPLLLTRGVSGSASTAVYSSLLSEFGADSFEAFCASVIMGSSDTMIYVITVYFSSVGVKKTGYSFFCAGAVMLFIIFFGCFVSRVFF